MFDLGAGKSFDYGKTNTIYDPSVTAATFANSSASPLYFLAAAGYLWSRNHQWLPYISTGLQYRYTSPVVVSGGFTSSLIPPILSLVSFKNKIQENSLLFSVKADLYEYGRVMPYVAGGIGASWNRISQFQTLFPFGLSFEFEPKTASDVSYNLGLGVDFKAKPDLWLSLGYSYDYFGENKTGPGETFTNNQPAVFNPAFPILPVVKRASLHAHSFFLTARYLFA